MAADKSGHNFQPQIEESANQSNYIKLYISSPSSLIYFDIVSTVLPRIQNYLIHWINVLTLVLVAFFKNKSRQDFYLFPFFGPGIQKWDSPLCRCLIQYILDHHYLEHAVDCPMIKTTLPPGWKYIKRKYITMRVLERNLKFIVKFWVCKEKTWKVIIFIDRLLLTWLRAELKRQPAQPVLLVIHHRK